MEQKSMYIRIYKETMNQMGKKHKTDFTKKTYARQKKAPLFSDVCPEGKTAKQTMQWLS